MCRNRSGPETLSTLLKGINYLTTMWQNYTNAVLGLVLIGLAIYNYALLGTTLGWTVGIVGLVIVVVGFWGGVALPEGTVRHA